MKLQVVHYTILFLFIGLAACKEDDQTVSICDQQVIISSSDYVNAPNDHLNILSAEITGNCLRINFGSSGCDGSSWELKLIDSEAILESYPPQRNIRLSLKNVELCDAYFTKEISFEIKELQVDGDRVALNLDGFGDQILYVY